LTDEVEFLEFDEADSVEAFHELHGLTHTKSGRDPLAVDDLSTAESRPDMILVSDGIGGVMWAANERLRGPVGPPGLDGIDGDQGPRGDEGPPGLQGDPGPIVPVESLPTQSRKKDVVLSPNGKGGLVWRSVDDLRGPKGDRGDRGKDGESRFVVGSGGGGSGSSQQPAGMTAAEHRALDQLVHILAETSFDEIIYTTGKVSDVITWTSAAKTLKVRDVALTYSGNQVTQTVTQQYDGGGSVVETITETYSYTGNNLDSVTRTLT